MTINSAALSDFRRRCHEYYTCLTFATLGLQNVADYFKPAVSDNQESALFIGSQHPDDGKFHSRILLKDAVEYSEKDGLFSDTLAKAFIVAIYTLWDETYRPKIASELGVETKSIACDFMGDMRFVRHWIIHNKSVIDKNCEKLNVLSKIFRQGEELRITGDFFSEIMEQVNTMSVSVNSR